jgi:glucose/mannose-6-phosphate isomerase
MGKSVVVYAGPTLVAAGYKWKISFNENAKQIAWFGVYPEFNHNEFIGWSEQPEHKPYAVIDLRSSFDHPRVTARFELSDRLLSGKRPAVHVVEAQGDTALAQALWASMLGDFVTIYTALLAGQDPAPVDLVEKFKKKLAEV